MATLLHALYRTVISVMFSICPLLYTMCVFVYTVKPVHTGMPRGQTIIPVWTGSGLERVFAFREEQTTITCTIDMRAIVGRSKNDK